MKVRRRVKSIADDHRVTTFELFFDLVFVFAFTQLTAYMTHNHTAAGVVQAMLLLALFWWSWSAYAWLGNQANAAVGTVRAVMLVAMTAVFILALATPEAWHDAPGGLHGPTVLTAAYIVVRVAHQVVYLMAARGDPALQRQLVRNVIPLMSGVVLLVIGVAVGGTGQTVLWALALAADWGATYLTSRGGGGWRINSRIHWVERHGIVIILALGESIVAIGTGASGQPISWTLLAAAVLGILIAAALWWLYFDIAADAAEESLGRREGTELVKTVINAYSYGHFVLIAGIVVIAFGVEEALAHAGDSKSAGAFNAGALSIGAAVYVVGFAAFWFALEHEVVWSRVVAAAALIAVWPLLASVRPLVGIAVILAILVALVGVEVRDRGRVEQLGVGRNPS
jgi:low temperature requirement protein LtrA